MRTKPKKRKRQKRQKIKHLYREHLTKSLLTNIALPSPPKATFPTQIPPIHCIISLLGEEEEQFILTHGASKDKNHVVETKTKALTGNFSHLEKFVLPSLASFANYYAREQMAS